MDFLSNLTDRRLLPLYIHYAKSFMQSTALKSDMRQKRKKVLGSSGGSWRRMSLLLLPSKVCNLEIESNASQSSSIPLGSMLIFPFLQDYLKTRRF